MEYAAHFSESESEFKPESKSKPEPRSKLRSEFNIRRFLSIITDELKNDIFINNNTR